MSTIPATTQVAIVGAGPAGLTLGCVLAASKIPFVILDRLAEGANTSRAAVVHARTLEVLEGLGASDRMMAQGHKVQRFAMRDRDRVLVRVPWDQLPTKYPYTLMLPQQHTEAILLDRLRALGGDIHRPCVVSDVSQDAEAGTLTYTTNGGAPQTLRARYVVGTDGMHSLVREKSGIGFHGESYEASFVLADVRVDWSLSHDEVMIFLSPEGLMVVAPLPGDMRYRIVATVDDAPEHPDVSHIQGLVDSRGPTKGGSKVSELIWASRFRVHHRLANRYRAGRFLLAGDAAHVHSPAGGQGMNTGIQDAVALGHALTATLGGSSDAPLDEYERVRRPIAERVVKFTDTMTRMATLRPAPARAIRNTIISTLGKLPPFRHNLAMELSELRNR